MLRTLRCRLEQVEAARREAAGVVVYHGQPGGGAVAVHLLTRQRRELSAAELRAELRQARAAGERVVTIQQRYGVAANAR